MFGFREFSCALIVDDILRLFLQAFFFLSCELCLPSTPVGLVFHSNADGFTYVLSKLHEALVAHAWDRAEDLEGRFLVDLVGLRLLDGTCTRDERFQDAAEAELTVELKRCFGVRGCPLAATDACCPCIVSLEEPVDVSSGVLDLDREADAVALSELGLREMLYEDVQPVLNLE